MPPPLSSSRSLPLNASGSAIENASRRKPDGSSTHKRRPSESHQPEPGSKRAKMAKVLGKQPEVRHGFGNLTKPPSSLRPQNGTKKLVIKNLRTNSRTKDLEQYYSNTRKEMEDALIAILARRHPAQPFERLYRGVEDLCRKGDYRLLHKLLTDKCKAYLIESVSKSIEAEAVSTNVAIEVLKSVHKYWVIWNQQTATLRSTFSYLDRSYLLNSKDHPQINDLAISLFRKMIFPSPNDTDFKNVKFKSGPSVIKGMCDLIEYDRRGDARFDGSLLHNSITMLHILNIYGRYFELRFLEGSASYFQEFAEEKSASTLSLYILACEKLLAAEDKRCNTYNFDSTTKRQLMDKAHRILIDNYSDKLLDSGEVGKLLDKNDVDSMKALYDLLRLSSIQKKLKDPWETYIKEAGANIVNDTSRGDEMVVRLLLFRRSLDILIRDAFNQDDDFTYGLREAFGSFINDKKILSSWKTGTSKVGEMIAKYIDLLLRGGLKTISQSLLSDMKDRAAAEKNGLSSTSDEDAELDRQLDNALELFRFIEGKDVFEAFYKQDLARRLLMGRSASADAERSMLTKLKSECGSSFTQNLEQMFKDQELSRDEISAYKSWREGTGRDKSGVDLNVSVLSASAWPSYPDPHVFLPQEVAKQIEQFDSYYTNKHTGRRLTWKHSLAHCVVKAKFNRGLKELLVSAYQAIVLELFNQVEDKQDGILAYSQIAEGSGLSGPDLDRTLQSLACARLRVLTKHPKGKDVNNTDTFTVNKSFSDPKYRIKINQIQLKETKEENQDTHKKVAADRQFETQAAIVRIMKSRKEMTHANLVAEIIDQTKSRGAVEPAEIKKNIEKLIEKDYLERDGGSYTYLA